jgi:hypothetical protein
LGLFDTTSEHPHSRMRRYLITTLVFIALVLGGIWWLLRYHQEKVTARHFLTAVVAGRMEEAYKIWKPSQTYTFKDFWRIGDRTVFTAQSAAITTKMPSRSRKMAPA